MLKTKQILMAEAVAEELPATGGAEEPALNTVQDATPSVVEDSETDEVDWGSLVDEDEVEESEALEAPPAEEPEVIPAAAEAEPEVAPAEVEPEPEVPEPEAVVEEPKAEEQPAEPEVPAEPMPSLEEQEAQRAALRMQAVQQLEQQYAMDEDAVNEFETDPGKALPKMAADLHMRIFESVVPAIVEQLAPQIETVIKARETKANIEDSFYGRWPELKEHREQVNQMAYMWRQMNPQASEDEAIENVGKYAMAALGLQGAVAEQPAEVAPEPPPPPAPGAVHTPPATSKAKNMWEELADEFDSE